MCVLSVKCRGTLLNPQTRRSPSPLYDPGTISAVKRSLPSHLCYLWVGEERERTHSGTPPPQGMFLCLLAEPAPVIGCLRFKWEFKWKKDIRLRPGVAAGGVACFWANQLDAGGGYILYFSKDSRSRGWKQIGVHATVLN